MFVYIYSLSVYLLRFILFQHCIKMEYDSSYFFYPSTRKKLFPALAANKVGLKESFASILSFR